MGIGKEERDRSRIEAVLQILRKQVPLTVKQEKFCTDACVERFLRCKGDNVKKAAKHLRACLSWRDAVGTEHLIADEFPAELADGAAYVAGHDDDARPVMVFRIKQDYLKFQSQRSYLRLLAFTLEVAVSSMSRFVEQFVLLFDASLFRSASAFLNQFMGTLKIISEYYPGRLHRAFVIDPPSLFSYLWKVPCAHQSRSRARSLFVSGPSLVCFARRLSWLTQKSLQGVRPFVELWTSTAVVWSLDFEDSLEGQFPFASAYHPRTASLRFDPSGVPAAKAGGSMSSRFSFTVSHLDALKPWYLTRTDPTPPPAAASSPCLAGLSPLNARSFSFASPGARLAATPQHHRLGGGNPPGARSIPSTPSSRQPPRTPRPSFLQSPAAAMRLFGGRSSKEAGDLEEEGRRGRAEKGREAFLPFLRFYRRPYDEVAYRSKMRPPLGGLISIVSPHMIRLRRRLSHHQRF
ncbi:hypothetical protein Taro_015794 [Colocasia esculenta]|uniref:CRAL-TRIO domain-containing protein n=1 Tax=Colocasia esculenta TaxID=4460 RepID=A0A843UM51_COLES|nr:hypothetical protein [Colocasia esculenta]